MSRNTVLFDVNETVLDIGTLKPIFKAVFGEESAAATWFSMLLHSTTVCALTDVKTHFATVAGIMLHTLAARRGILLSDDTQQEILNNFASLPPHKDIKPSLNKLRLAGYRTVAFSNSSTELMGKQIDNAGLTNNFDQFISVEDTGSFKPATEVYSFVAQRLSQPIQDLRLVATHDWDTHGALCAGMKAAYLDRSGAPYHACYRKPDIVSKNMNDIVAKIIATNGKGQETSN